MPPAGCICGGADPHIGEGQVILHQPSKSWGELIPHQPARTQTQSSSPGGPFAEGRLLLQVNTGIGIHAAQLNQITMARAVLGVASLQPPPIARLSATQTLQQRYSHSGIRPTKTASTQTRLIRTDANRPTSNSLPPQRITWWWNVNKLQEVTNRQVNLPSTPGPRPSPRRTVFRVNTRNRPTFQQTTGLHRVSGRVTPTGRAGAGAALRRGNAGSSLNAPAFPYRDRCTAAPDPYLPGCVEPRGCRDDSHQ